MRANAAACGIHCLALAMAGGGLLFAALVHANAGLAETAVAGIADAAALPAITLDKASQRRAGLRTRRADAPPDALDLPARIVVDPRRHRRVMADQAGVVHPPVNGFPLPGEVVKAGQVLAWLRPTLTDPDRRDLEGERVAARRDVALGKLQIERYNIDEAEHLEVKLPTPSIQILTEYRIAQAREAQLDRALSSRMAIRAPAAGVVLRSSVRADRVAAGGETLFEIGAQTALAVELLFSDDGLDSRGAVVARTRGNKFAALQFLGQTLDPPSRSQRVLYALEESDAGLVVGEPVQVRVPRAQLARQWLLPAKALFASQGRQWVWVHEEPERFVARQVRANPAVGGWYRVDAGLDGAARVVVDGVAALGGRL
jgi:hypothetical protein